MSFHAPLRTLLAGAFPEKLPAPGWWRGVRLAGEALIFTLVGSYLPAAMGFPQSGMISVFLIAASLTDRFGIVLEENRENIYTRSMGAWRANRITALSLLCMFLGILAGYAIVAGWLEDAAITRLFGFTMQIAQVGKDGLLEARFASLAEILLHNSLVLMAIACLSFVYRSYGAMLGLCWNACVWAIVLTVLSQRAGTASELSSPVFVAMAMAALLPHLTCEGFAYVLGSLAAIFLSKALASYSLGDARVREVARVAALLLACAFGMLLLAATFESSLAPALLARL
jgi:hypothetical protein